MARRSLGGATLAIGALAFACASPPPPQLGTRNGRLMDCPDSPNCVSTQASDEARRTRPFVLALPAEQAWERVPEAVEAIGGKIVVQEDAYLHAEFSSPLMGYVDDLELLLLPARGRIAVRSASRTGYYDMGVNRERVWLLRRELDQRGVLP